MLRAVLGVCGVSLIGFGVFGGSMLESLHRGINGVFTPATVVVEASSKPDVAVSQPEIAVASQADVGAVALLASETKLQHTPEVIESNPLQEIAAVAQPIAAVEPAATMIVLPDVAGKTLLTASQPADSAMEDAQDDSVKEEGVEVVLSATNGLPNNTLFVLKDKVNMREGPSTDHSVVLMLEMGQELMEFKREGKWVHVGAYGTSGKIGWVHGTLVGDN